MEKWREEYLIISSLLLIARNKMAKINGVLRDPFEQPLPNVEIELSAKETSATVLVNTKSRKKTDQDGRYEFDLAPGRYHVTVFHPGYPAWKVGDLRVYTSTASADLNILLNAPQEEPAPEWFTRIEHEQALAKAAAETATTKANIATGAASTAAKKANIATDAAATATQKAQEASASSQSASDDAAQAKSANNTAQAASKSASDDAQSAAQSSSEASQHNSEAQSASVSARESKAQTEQLTNEARAARDEAVSATESKVDKVPGKGLSSNDFTDGEKSKLEGIAPAATRNLPDVDLSSLALAEMSGGKVVVHKDAHGELQMAYRQSVITYDDLGISNCPFSGPIDVFRAQDSSIKPYHDIGIHLSAPKGASVISQAAKIPINRVDFDELRAKSESVAANAMLCGVYEYALLKWVMLAIGHQPGGNTEYGRYHADRKQVGRRADGRVPNDRSGEARTLTGTGPDEWRHDGSPFGVADLTGNQWEWCEGLKMIDGEFVVAEYCGQPESQWINTGRFIAPGHKFAMANRGDARSSQVWSEFTKEDGYEGHDLLQRLCIEPIECTRALKGRFYYDTTGERSPRVGGEWGAGSDAGPAALNLYHPRSVRHSYFGGRLAFRV